MVPPTAVESSLNFQDHPSIKSTEDPLVQKLSLKDDVTIRHNAPPPTLYEDGLLEKGTTISSTGALMAYSGKKTGRSPKDKRIVEEETSSQHIWWGPVNKQVDELTWKISRSRALDYLRTREKLFVVDAFAGWDPRYRIKVRIICARAYHALFMTNMLIRPTEEELKNFGEPDFTIYNAGQFPANTYTKGMTSSTSVEINFKDMEMVILGTEYAGEMKKGIFTVMFYLMPIKHKVLTLHSSANQGIEKGDVTLFFGLSGTGKTTLSADPNRKLIGDDEHCWSDNGVFNIEGGCYAKCLDLSQEKEPEIFNSIKFGSILENVVYDPETKVVDYSDSTITENTRCAYPIDYIPSAKIPCLADTHPTNIILLTCDASGVLPPVSKLTNSQVMYHFISGYTSKMAGTEEGVTEPQATFSACFGQPFLVLHPMKYAQQLSDKISKHNANAWLLNTGWAGASAARGGKRCPLKYTRAILDAIHNGSLSKVEYEEFPVFNLHVPKTCPGVPSELLNPINAWSEGEASFKKEISSLAGKFVENFKKYADQATPEVQAAGPTV
ncbi:Protein kinase C-like 1 [Candidozyma auris]|uniref:Phosphoenolpyruvate carboxykinase (ATP) n=2 Tax=Candidozyma auris TaxID=498019 RepID=A0A2H0ZKB0_CANAR|nr:phosphoenolpyruvate_carboxykinase_[ATP] [[Candida] auris]KND99205.1 phosphoenolpyruvate carboxykinase, putative [[Candida] auris]PIS51097.1 phosphoenolpyruvate carboxykinase [ATP] [[Candida] auris]PIS53063.1 phosphoenolpyruvate carboxykinase [ATP] [[Candida] auris]PSK77942.1 phosphoenolpyruvate carboxykinase [ATP] [[Candida] auris]QEL59351.1 phosphoenolpyruvate carboxykinase [ATP] [[Candida] auris]